MSERTKRFAFSFMKRNAPRRGPTSSDAWNDSFDEVANDLASVQAEWNNNLLPVFEGLPDGTVDVNVDAWANGIDGNNLFVDSTLTNSSAVLTYFDVGLNRPVTIKEAIDDVYDRIVAEVATLTTSISAASSGLTAAQKTAIGDNIFNSLSTSTSSSLDGKSENNRLNTLQLAKDLYGSTYNLGNDGVADLTNSVADMVDALLTLHNGNWSDDVTLSHTGISLSLAQTDIAQSSVYNDSYAGSPSSTQDDLNQVRATIKAIAGTTAWTTALPELYSSGPNSLKDLLDSTNGSGTKTSANPWGYQYDNIDGLVTRLNAVRDFCGMGSLTDGSPLYSGQNFISNGQPLEFAVSQLDQDLFVVSGICQNATQLQGYDIATTAPTVSGQVQTWNVAQSAYKPQMPFTNEFLGKPLISEHPTLSGQSMAWNGSGWKPISVPCRVRDVSNTTDTSDNPIYLTNNDSGKVYPCEWLAVGDPDPFVFILPSGNPGLQYTFIDVDASVVAVQVTNATAQVGASSCNYRVVSTAAGDTITLISTSASKWIAISYIGTWSLQSV